MAIITLTVVRIIMNSSYVLINTTPFVRPPKADGITLPVAWVSILCCQCAIRPVGRVEAYLGLGGFRSVVRIAPAQMTGGQMALSNHAQMGLGASDRGELVQSGDAWM